MEIGGYEIDNKYVAAGAAGLGVLFLLARNRQTAQPSNVATLQPPNGLSWSDVLGGPPASGLVGSPGEGGPPGPPGPAGPPGTNGGGTGSGGGKTCMHVGGTCTKNSDCCGSHVCVDDICTKPAPGGGGGHSGGGGGGGGGNPGGGGGNGTCSTNDDCRKNEKCRHGQCIPRTGGNTVGVPRGEGPGHGNGNPTRPNRPGPRVNTNPRMPNRLDSSGTRNNLDGPANRSPRDQARRDQGNNRITRETINGNHVTLIDRGGHERATGRNANANASGGTIHHGDINGPGHTRVNVSGGRATANASGGNGNVSGNRAKQFVRKAFGRGGEAASYEQSDNGYGRIDGQGNQASDFVNTHPTPGGRIAGFNPLPMPVRGSGETTTVQPGESLRGVARRIYGYDHFVPRLYTLNQDILSGRTTLQAGTVLRV